LTQNGYYLQGWRLDNDGNPPPNTNLLQSLETVNVANLTGTARPTANITWALNLPGNDTVGATHATSVQMFDKQGSTQVMNMTWAKTGKDTWTLLGAFDGGANFASDDTGTATFAAAATNYFPTADLSNTSKFGLTNATGNINGLVGPFT